MLVVVMNNNFINESLSIVYKKILEAWLNILPEKLIGRTSLKMS